MPGASRPALAAALALVCIGGALALAREPAATSEAAARAGLTNDVRPAKVSGYTGTAFVCATLRGRCMKISKPVAVPIPSFIDARKRAVTVASTDADGNPARTKVYGAIFELEQKTAGAILVARLAGGHLSATCKTSGTTRRLIGDGAGALRIVGRYATATIGGDAAAPAGRSAVLVTDTCTSTRVLSTAGTAEVISAASGDVTTLKPGARLIVRAPAPAPLPPAPPGAVGKPGVDSAVEPVRSIKGFAGPVTVCRSFGRDCQTLTAATLVPIGYVIDTTKGAILLRTVPGPGTGAGLTRAAGAAQGMKLYAGIFKTVQMKQSGAILKALLQGGDFKGGCASQLRAARAATGSSILRAPRYRVRRVKATGTGPVEVDGRYAYAITKATAFEVVDECDSSLVTVTKGAVVVGDPRGKGSKKTVRAPGSRRIPR